MPFRFKLQKVLDYREQMEEEAKVRLAEATMRHDEAVRALQQAQQALEAERQHQTVDPLMSAAERWVSDQYIKGLTNDVHMADMQERMTAQVQEEARKMLAVRALDRQMLDKLKERQKRNFQHEELQKEQHFNDEIATIRFKAEAV